MIGPDLRNIRRLVFGSPKQSPGHSFRTIDSNAGLQADRDHFTSLL